MSFISRWKAALKTAEGKFFVFLISGFVVFSILILAGAFLVDPHEDFGTGLIDPLVLTNRSEKLEMIEALDENPEILIFGSSRTFTIDPDHIFELTGRRAFNASVSYGRSEDHNAIIHFLTQERAVHPETLVIGFSAGAFNDDPIETQLLNNKYLKSYLAEPPTPLWKRAPRILKSKLNGQYVGDIFRSLFFHASGFPADRVSFLPNGMQDTHDSPYDAIKIDENYYRALALFENMSEPNWDRLEAFRSLVRYSIDNNFEVNVVLLPMPSVTRARLIEDTDLIAIEERLKVLFTDEMPDNVTFYDFSEVDSFGGSEEGFNDPTHPNIANTRLITEAIFGDRPSP